MNKFRKLTQLVTLAFASFLVSCSEASVESFRVPGVLSYNVDDLTLSEDAFRTSVYPIVRQYCATCHAQDQSPYFANSNLISAHDTLIFGQKVDFTFPSESTLVRRIRDLRHGCWSGDCARDAQTMTEAIEQWSLALGDQKPENPIKQQTQQLLIPDTIPVAVAIGGDGNVTNATTELTFSIASMFSPPMTYANLRIRIGQLDQSTYLVSRPFLVASEEIEIGGVYVLINGISLPTTNAFKLIDLIVPFNSNQNANTNNVQMNNPSLLSSSSAIIPIQNGKGVDLLSIVFTKLQRP